MRIITTVDELHTDRRTAIAIGKFDGVHLGHQRLLAQILAAKAEGLQAVVFTFEPPPELIFGMGDVRLLTTREEKRRILAALGIDLLIEYPMDFVTAAVSPAEFIRTYLVRRLHAGLIAAGGDLSYGAKGSGDFALLDALKEEGGYRTMRVEKLCIDGAVVSSSRIKALVTAGELQAAAACLGRDYTLIGTVRHGRGIGHTLGFPTVNIYPNVQKVLPPYGVYLSQVRVEAQNAAGDMSDAHTGEIYRGITNIGVKPTIGKTEELAAETYLYDFDGDLYGHEMSVSLQQFLRPERRFAGMDALKEQLRKDIAAGEQNG